MRPDRIRQATQRAKELMDALADEGWSAQEIGAGFLAALHRLPLAHLTRCYPKQADLLARWGSVVAELGRIARAAR